MNSTTSSVRNARTLRGRRTSGRTNGRTSLMNRTSTPWWLARLGRGLLTVLGAALLWCASVSAAFAQGGGGGGSGSGTFVNKINALVDKLTPILTPLAILGFLIVAAAYVSTPIAREWAEQNKKAAGSIIVGLVLALILKDIVNFFTSL